MVLYHAITMFHLQEFILHRINYHPTERAVLLCSGYGKTMIDNLCAYGYFDEVRIYRYHSIQSKDYNGIKEEVNKALSSLIPDITQFEEIYIAGAQFYFSLWCIDSKIHFNFFEEAVGRLTDSYGLRESVRMSGALLQDELAESHGMYTGRNEWVKNIYCKFDAQDISLICDEDVNKLKDFDVLKELDKLSYEDRHKILELFDVPEKIDIPDNAFLMITQHFHNLRMMSFEEQASMYQLTSDYYLDGINLVYKPHPSDLHYYSLLDPGATIIKGTFPLELMIASFSQPPLGVAAISSTGIHNLKHHSEKCLLFNDLYLKTFIGNHIYYFFFKLAEHLSLDGKDIYFAGANAQQLKNFNEFAFDGKFSDMSEGLHGSGKLYMIDCAIDLDKNTKKFIAAMKTIKKEAIILFTNTDMQFSFFVDYMGNWKQSIIENIIPKHIEILPLMEDNDDIYTETGIQTVYIYTKSTKIRKEIQAMSYEKTLVSSGVKTRIPEDTDKDTKIAVLNGILDATEKRLLYYINREKELINIIKEGGLKFEK